LLIEFQRFVEALLPRAVMLENVPGLAKDRRFRIFLRRMKELNYMGDYRILNAADYGVPQRRRRLIYLAGRNKQIPFARPLRRRKTVRDVIGTLPRSGESGDPIHDLPERRSPHVIKIIRKIAKDGGSRADLPQNMQLDCHKRCNGFKDIYGRMAWDDVAPTITAGCFNPSKGRFIHPEENRAITMREAALLQSFPRRYKFNASAGKIAIAAMIGNALPPEFIRRLSSEVIKSLIRE
jgi:DNA (cytosine-5)-methyltransferase 1